MWNAKAGVVGLLIVRLVQAPWVLEREMKGPWRDAEQVDLILFLRVSMVLSIKSGGSTSKYGRCIDVLTSMVVYSSGLIIAWLQAPNTRLARD